MGRVPRGAECLLVRRVPYPQQAFAPVTTVVIAVPGLGREEHQCGAVVHRPVGGGPQQERHRQGHRGAAAALMTHAVPQGGQAVRRMLLIRCRQGAQQIRHIVSRTVGMAELAPVDVVNRRFAAGQQLGHMLAHIGAAGAAGDFAVGLGHARDDATGVRQTGRSARLG